MLSRKIFGWVMTGMLVTVASCASLYANEPDASKPDSEISPTPSPSIDRPLQPSDSATSQPDTKIITMNLEGQPTEVELKRFHQSALPFTTYYPEQSFTPEMSTSEDGTGVRFYFSPTGKKDENAYIYFFFPDRSNTLTSIQDSILGDQGLLVRNGWELIDRTDIVSYLWAEEKLLYQQQGEELMVGAIYIGQEDGQTFYTLTHYPIEYADGFEPRSNIVLENLQF